MRVNIHFLINNVVSNQLDLIWVDNCLGNTLQILR